MARLMAREDCAKAALIEMKDVIISLVTVCLNSEETLERTFQSVLNQSLLPAEYIVIDGASTDGTIKIITNYEPIFRAAGVSFLWESEKDKGLYDAMNKGLEKTNGYIIGILNSDDYYEKDTVGLIASACRKNPAAEILYGFMRNLDGGVEVSASRWNYDYMYSRDNKSDICSGAQHPTCFVKKTVYDEIGKFDLSFRTAADFDFLLRAKQQGKKFHAIDAILTNFSLGGLSNRISDAELIDQKSRIMFKNDLIDKTTFDKMKKKLKYTKYKALKAKILDFILAVR